MSLGLKNKVSKIDFEKLFPLIAKNKWISKREDKLIELLKFCGENDLKEFIIELLERFYFIEPESFAENILHMADFIVNESGFDPKRTVIATLTDDSEPDSGQLIIQALKLPLDQAGWEGEELVNKFGDINKSYKKGFDQIIFVDEFIGSGKTVMNRIKRLPALINGAYEVKFCFMAGMYSGIELIEQEGYDLFCLLKMRKGISEYYKDEELVSKKNKMNQLESKLANTINGNLLIEHEFGWGWAESLYSAEDITGNTPNSVFPIFWWPKTSENIKRSTLLTRVQKGLK